MTKISLYGFNNLTKSLSFTLYKLHYLTSTQNKIAYNSYINERFCADNLTTILTQICHTIGGNILNIANQNYQPQGASVTLMISEEAQPESLVAHLDKSHLCIHTYPEENPQDGVAIFRADIELSTCGVISPLKVLNKVIEDFKPDVVDIDYRIRGMTRNQQGKKLYGDELLNNLSDHLKPTLAQSYVIKNYNLPKQNLFHSKLCKKHDFLDNYLFSQNKLSLNERQQSEIMFKIERERKQLFLHDD